MVELERAQIFRAWAFSEPWFSSSDELKLFNPNGRALSSLTGFTLFGSFCLYIYVFKSFLGSRALKKAQPGN